MASLPVFGQGKSGADLGVGRGLESDRPDILVAWHNTERVLGVEILVRSLRDKAGQGTVHLDLADERRKTLLSTDAMRLWVPANKDGGEDGATVQETPTTLGTPVALSSGMKSWARGTAVGLIALLPSIPAASAAFRGFSLSARTTHLSVYTSPGEKVDANAVERQVAWVADELGLTEVPHADYYRYKDAAALRATTGLYAGGVSYPERRQVLSTDATRDHELVHLLAHQLGDPGPFFQEGLAVWLGDKGRFQGRGVDSVAKPWARRAPVTSLIARFDAATPGEGYAVAGSFVKWLCGRYGLPRVAEFFRACRKYPAPAALSQVFGLSLAEAGSEWTRAL